MVVFVVRERLFYDRDGRGAGATTTFRAVGLFVAGGSLHAEWALVPLAVNPNVSEDMTLEASLVVMRMVLGQRSEDNGAVGNSFFFSHLDSMGKRVGVYPKTSFSINFTGRCRGMISLDIDRIGSRTCRGRDKGNKAHVSGEGDMIDRGDRSWSRARLTASGGRTRGTRRRHVSSGVFAGWTGRDKEDLRPGSAKEG